MVAIGGIGDRLLVWRNLAATNDDGPMVGLRLQSKGHIAPLAITAWARSAVPVHLPNQLLERAKRAC